MRNPLNAGAQVNVTSPLFDENKNYLYSNLELTPNVFAHIAMSLCRGTQRSRGDVITGVVVYHQTHGGITAGNEYISTFKKATKILRNKGLLKNLGYGQWLFKSEANETSLELDSYVTKEEDSQISIDETLGTGNETVYVYYYDAYRQLAETRGQKHWPCKVGMTSQQTISRIFSQTGTAYPESPHIAIEFKCNDAKGLENAFHSVLSFRKRKVESAPGNEWYYTTLEELKEIFDFVLNGTEPISELRKPEGNDEDYSI